MLSLARFFTYSLALCAVPLLHGCTSIVCSMSVTERSTYESLRDIEHPTVGALYWVEGTYYADYHSSGLIPVVFSHTIDAESFRLEKNGAYCVRVGSDCAGALDPHHKATRLGTGEAVARISALVRFMSRDVAVVDPGQNQCLAGTVQIERIQSIRWY